MEKRIRSLDTLTDDELILIVDNLVYCSRTRKQSDDLIGEGDMYYRKIEVKLEGGQDVIFRVSYAEYNGVPTVIAFYLEDGSNDISILPINRSKYTKEFVNAIGITLDFSIIDQPLRSTYMLFAETLQFWNLSQVDFMINGNLTEDWYTVEELTVTDF